MHIKQINKTARTIFAALSATFIFGLAACNSATTEESTEEVTEEVETNTEEDTSENAASEHPTDSEHPTGSEHPSTEHPE